MAQALVAGASIQDLEFLARVAESSERYDDMVLFTTSLVENSESDLSVDQRNLLSVAYKNQVGSRRASWRSLSAEEKGNAHIQAYKQQVEKELEEICNKIIGLLKDHLIPKVANEKNEAHVFYLKMAGDYYRYLAEFKDDDDVKSQAEVHYEKASTIGEQNLPPTHPIRLGLSLNRSVCHYEILKDKKKACELAKKAFDDAIAKLDQLDEASYKDSTLIMQLLRDNLTLWTNDDAEN